MARQDADVELVASATTWEQLRTALDTIGKPDVAIVDLHLSQGEDSLEAIAELTAHGIRVLMLTS